MITAEQIRRVFPRAKLAYVQAIVDHWDVAEAAGITTPRRIRHFFAQIGPESAGLTRLDENLNYSAERLHAVWPKRFPTVESAKPYAKNPRKLAIKVYGGRMGNAPSPSNDGWDYRGSGFGQTTGKDNFEAAGYADDPDALRNDPSAAFKAAVTFWRDHKLNALADKDSVTAIRKIWNGGTNGLDDAKGYLAVGKKVWPDAAAPAKPKVATLLDVPDDDAPAGDDAAPTMEPSEQQIEFVQTRLRDLKYFEVGEPDGRMGDRTRGAIGTFRGDNGLPAGDAIDADLIVALSTAKPREEAASRAGATAAQVREKVPEAATNWQAKLASLWTGFLSLLVAIGAAVIQGFQTAWDYTQPIRDAFGDVPVWVWPAGVAAVLGVLYLLNHKAEHDAVDAFKEGKRL